MNTVKNQAVGVIENGTSKRESEEAAVNQKLEGIKEGSGESNSKESNRKNSN